MNKPAILIAVLGLLGCGVVGAAPSPTAPPPTVTPSPTATPTLTPTLTPSPSPTPPQTTHTVLPGDSLSAIAARYGVNLFTLLQTNRLTQQSVLVEGQTLAIPQAGGEFTHEVRSGETLSAIAYTYGVPTAELIAANDLPDGNLIVPGQTLVIPAAAAPVALPTAVPPFLPGDVSGPWLADWSRSLMRGGDLAANYPLTVARGRFTLHYQPYTYTEANLPYVLSELETALAATEDKLGTAMPGTFDIYAAGTLYGGRNAHLRGFSGRERDLYLLIDGSGERYENRYLYIHEMTHMIARNAWGPPATIMLSEGLATWAGAEAWAEGGYMTLEGTCQAAANAGTLPNLAAIERDFTQFEGHTRHRLNYVTSGCFVGWLVATYGLEAVEDVYRTNGYQRVTGQPLGGLLTAWRVTYPQQVASTEDRAIVPYSAEVRQAYAYLLPLYDASPNLHRAYATLDQARLALWRGDYVAAREWLDSFYNITGFNP